MSDDKAGNPLAELLPAPSDPRDARGPWGEIEDDLGIGLPGDYKWFIDVYGTGQINQLVWVYNPRSPNPYLNLMESLPVVLSAVRTTRDSFPDVVPHRIFPEPGGLLPWAATDNGDFCFWVTDPTGRPDEWAIAVDEVRGYGFVDAEGPMTTFLRRLLLGLLWTRSSGSSSPIGGPGSTRSKSDLWLIRLRHHRFRAKGRRLRDGRRSAGPPTAGEQFLVVPIQESPVGTFIGGADSSQLPSFWLSKSLRPCVDAGSVGGDV